MRTISAIRLTLFCSLLTAAVLVTAVNGDDIYSKNKKANSLYKQGKFNEALKLYEDALLLDPADNKLKMNKGSALYQLEDYENAESAYSEALSEKDKKVLAHAHYNLGNILFKQGEKLEAAGNPAAQERYSKALENYINSLKLRPNDRDAKWNLQLAHQKVQMMQNQQNQSQDNDKKDDQNKNDQNKDQQQKDDQNKENQNQEQKKEQDKQDKQDQQNSQEQNQKKEQNQQNQADQNKDEQEMKKEEAQRLIELYADDADTLNKPQKKYPARIGQPEKDW